MALVARGDCAAVRGARIRRNENRNKFIFQLGSRETSILARDKIPYSRGIHLSDSKLFVFDEFAFINLRVSEKLVFASLKLPSSRNSYMQNNISRSSGFYISWSRFHVPEESVFARSYSSVFRNLSSQIKILRLRRIYL